MDTAPSNMFNVSITIYIYSNIFEYIYSNNGFILTSSPGIGLQAGLFGV